MVRNKKNKFLKNKRIYQVDITDSKQIELFSRECQKVDVIISCIGSQTGGVTEAWRVEYQANKNLLNLALKHKIDQFILLSAICVQKPKLEFQYAKIAFENLLIGSSIDYTIIRATAFFKSLSGQIRNLKNGKKFIYFDSGESTSCKPISQRDLALYIVQCIGVDSSINKIFPIGGPGPAITPRQIGFLLFKLLKREPQFRSIPSKLFTFAEKSLAPLTLFSNKAKNTQQFIKIAGYYAKESMLVFDYKTMRYDANLTPEFGEDTLENHYANLINASDMDDELGAHKLF